MYFDPKPRPFAAAQILQKWSQTEECPALQDILHMVYELNLMWTDAQRDFIGRYWSGRGWL